MASSVFSLTDQAVVRALSSNALETEVETLVPVACSVAKRISPVAKSMQAQQANCDKLGFPVHFASHSNALTKNSKPKHVFVAESLLHKSAATAKHSFVPATACDNVPINADKLLHQNSGCVLYLDSLVAMPNAIPPPPPRQDSFDPWAGRVLGGPKNSKCKPVSGNAWSAWKPGCLAVNSCSTNSAAEVIAPLGVYSVDVAHDELEKVLDFLAPAQSDSLLVPSTSLVQGEGDMCDTDVTTLDPTLADLGPQVGQAWQQTLGFRTAFAWQIHFNIFGRVANSSQRLRR